jgi:hypothetical protein
LIILSIVFLALNSNAKDKREDGPVEKIEVTGQRLMTPTPNVAGAANRRYLLSPTISVVNNKYRMLNNLVIASITKDIADQYVKRK